MTFSTPDGLEFKKEFFIDGTNEFNVDKQTWNLILCEKILLFDGLHKDVDENVEIVDEIFLRLIQFFNNIVDRKSVV